MSCPVPSHALSIPFFFLLAISVDFLLPTRTDGGGFTPLADPGPAEPGRPGDQLPKPADSPSTEPARTLTRSPASFCGPSQRWSKRAKDAVRKTFIELWKTRAWVRIWGGGVGNRHDKRERWKG
jgi:hypothetical protein